MVDLTTAVRDRLAEAVATLAHVGDGGELGELLESGRIAQRTPAAWVLPGDDRPDSPPPATGGHRQRVQETVVVLLAARTTGDRTGAQGRQALHPIRLAVLQALAGWSPDSTLEPLAYQRGQLRGIEQGAVTYELRLSSAWYLTKEVS